MTDLIRPIRRLLGRRGDTPEPSAAPATSAPAPPAIIGLWLRRSRG